MNVTPWTQCIQFRRSDFCPPTSTTCISCAWSLKVVSVMPIVRARHWRISCASGWKVGEKMRSRSEKKYTRLKRSKGQSPGWIEAGWMTHLSGNAASFRLSQARATAGSDHKAFRGSRKATGNGSPSPTSFASVMKSTCVVFAGSSSSSMSGSESRTYFMPCVRLLNICWR